jgi:hypothetical protein
VLAVGGALASGGGRLIQLGYPLAVLLVGMWLHRVSQPRYISFVLWVWMLTPLVRRLADYQAGWRDPSPILLAAYLVTAWPALLRLARALLALGALVSDPSARIAAAPGMGLFTLAALGVCAGVPFGMIAAPTSAVMAMLNWLVPIGFGWYLATLEDELGEVEHAVASTFLWAGLVVGSYGFWQYWSPQPWDAEWMRNSEITTIGQPEPFAVRVFSTMHSPGVLGAFLVAPLVIWMGRPRLLALPAAIAVAVTLVLSQVRTAWIAVAVATGLALLKAPARIRVRALVLASVAGVCVIPLLLSPEIADMAAERFATLTRPDSDASALSRLEGHVLAFDYVASHPFGGGLGFSEPRLEHLISINDSLVIATLVQFGLVGSLCYAVGLVLVLVKLASHYRHAASAESTALACVGLGLLATFWLGATTGGPPGMVFWLIGGLAIAGEAQRRRAMETRPALRLAPRPAWPATVPAWPSSEDGS